MACRHDAACAWKGPAVSTWDFVRDPSSVCLLVDFGEQRGVPATTLLRRTGLVKAQLRDPQVEVQAAQELLVVANLIRALKNPPGLGLEVGLQYGFTTYGIWGYGLISSATIADALALALRFMPLTYAFTQISAAPVDGHMVLKFGAPPVDEPVRSFLVQRDLAAAGRLVSELVGPGFQMDAVKLMGPAPGERARALLTHQWGGPCAFDADMNALIVRADYLSHRLPNANPLTASMCEQMCAALVERRRARHGTAELVRAHLLASAGDALPDLAHMARTLYTTERTLKRRLQAEGTSFRDLLATVQQQRACDLLLDGEVPLADIAGRLGFSDASSFSQAFKRWTGVAPGQWRLRQGG